VLKDKNRFIGFGGRKDIEKPYSFFIGHGMVIAGVLLVCTLAECCKKVYILLCTN
jgi:hypothetical protein